MKKKFLTSLLFLIFSAGFGLMETSAREKAIFDMEDTIQETKITLSENRLKIENLPVDSVLEVYSIVGVKVYSQTVKAGTNEFPLYLPKGYYIIRIGNIAKKIALR